MTCDPKNFIQHKTCDIIMDCACKVSHLREIHITSKSKRSDIVMCRQVIFSLMRKHTKLSQANIGWIVGGFDHSTVCWSERVVENEMFESQMSKKTTPLYSLYLETEEMVVGLLYPNREKVSV